MDETAKRNVLRSFPYAIYAVGTRTKQPKPPQEHVNAFIGTWAFQSSFKPPLLAIAVRRDTRSHQMIQESRVFTVNLFAKSQKNLAQRLFKPLQASEETINGLKYKPGKTGAPVFTQLPGHVECELVAMHHDGGDHDIFVGRIVAAAYDDAAAIPLTKDEAGWQYGG